MTRLQANRASHTDIVQALPKSLQIPQWRTKQMCYRVIKIFGGLMKKEFWIKSASQGATDGERYIYIPFHDPEAYAVTVHELSHNYFESDMLARDKFIDEFSKRLIIRFKRANSPLVAQPAFPERLKALLRYVVNLLEDQRCHALWGRVYPGDHMVLEQRWQRLTRQRVKEADEDFMSYAFFAARGIADEVNNPRPEFIAVRPVLESAFTEVESTDFVGCLIITRKTVEKILNVLLDYLDDDAQQQPQQNYTSSQSLQSQQASQAKVNAALSDDQQGGDDGEESGGESGDGTDQHGSGKQAQDPNDVERRRALMLQLMSNFCQKEDDLKGDENELYDDVTPSHFQKKSRQAQSKAAASSDEAFGVNPWSSDELLDALEAGEAAMAQKIQEARSWVQNIEVDDWLTKDSKCKVVFHDVTPSMLGGPVQLTDAEHAAAKRLKTKFIKILGARRATLEDAGDDLDVEAYIESLFDSTVTEVFEDEESGAGFYALLLCDMSGSMNGTPFEAVEHAEKMLRIGMDFPFVEIEKWGFTQHGNGTVDLIRIDPNADQSAAHLSNEIAWGLTPLHEAIRVSSRQCMLRNKVRRLFVLTDGAPYFTDFNGSDVATEQLLKFCKQNVATARQNNVGVYGLMIGSDMDDKTLTKMYGSHRYWRRATTTRKVSEALVSLVESQFVEYLRTKH